MNVKEKVQIEKVHAFLGKTWKFIVDKNIGTILAWVFIVGINIFYISTIVKEDNSEPQIDNDKTEQSISSDCNVLKVDIAGVITSNGINGSDSMFSSDGDTVYADDIKYQLDEAKKDDAIKAVILTINSYGGDAGSAQEIVYALKNLGKPIVAVIRSAGTSAGYWIATIADKIYAYETADVGSIGVTMSHLDETAVNTKDGKFFVSLSSGKFKDMGNPDKSLTAEERALMMRDINDVYNIFVKQVSQSRNISVEEVKKIADGSSMVAGRAKEKGLIDEVGSTYDAIDYITKTIGEKAELCEINED